MADDETVRGARRTGRGAPATLGAAAAKKTAKKVPAASAQPTAGAAGKRPAVKKAAAAGKAPAAEKASAVKKAPVVRKAPAAKKAPAAGAAGMAIRRTTARKAAPTTASGSRLAAEQTFDDDWQPPPPPPAREPVLEDPNARVRGILRAAAQTVAARERAEAAGTRRAPMPVPERPVVEETEEEPEDLAPPDGPPTQVLIAPVPAPAAVEPEELGIEDMAIDDMELDDDVVEDELPVAEEDEIVEDDVVEEADEDEVVGEAEDGDDWAPPEVIEADEPPPRRPAATLAEPRPVPPPPPEPSPPPATTPPPATDAPPPWEPPPAKPSGGRAGFGVPLLAIILSILIPLVGAVIGFLLATRARRRGARLAGLARVVAVLAFIAWLIGGGGALYAGRDKGVDYSKLKVGNCFNSSATNQVRGVKVIPCSKSHNSEIFFLVTHPAAKGAPYPGKDQLVQFAADACLGQPLTDYLGIPLEQSKLKDFEIVPQTSAWKDGRRVLVCGLDTGGQGKITGSVKGSRR